MKLSEFREALAALPIDYGSPALNRHAAIDEVLERHAHEALVRLANHRYDKPEVVELQIFDFVTAL